tara:strand:- start:509 stop:2221 length:1713 start_codon:yes stop_codon:yes gene_type:complete
MPHVTGHTPHGDGWGNTKPLAPPGQNPYGQHSGYGSNNNSNQTITSASGDKNETNNSWDSIWDNNSVEATNWTKDDNNKGSASQTNANWSTDSYPDPDPASDLNYNEINYNNQQNVAKVIDQWQLDNDNVNTFFTGGNTIINSKDKDTQELYTAGTDILNALGLDNNKNNMQIALNILQGGDRIWGKTKRALENATQEQINAIAGIKGQDIGATGKWNTWGTNLRGDATWGGKPTSQEDYQDKMAIFSGNWQGGTPLYNYQQMLVDNWQTANPNYKNSGSNKLGKAILGAMMPLQTAGFMWGVNGLETLKGNKAKPTNLKEAIKNPLGTIIPNGWIADPKDGVKSLTINGQEVTINNKTINTGDGGVFTKYDLLEANLGKDSGVTSSAPYYNTGNNIETDFVEVDETEEAQDEGESENTLTADNNPAWWNFKLFETIFSPLSALKYKTGDTVENDTVAKNMIMNVVEQAKVDNQAKAVLKHLVEDNEQISNIVDTYQDIKKSVTDVIGPLDISADISDASIQAETPSGFMTKVDLDDKELSINKQLGNLDLTASYNPSEKSGFLGLTKAF